VTTQSRYSMRGHVSRRWGEGLFVALVIACIFVLFHFWGNRSNVGMAPRSLFVWIARQWTNAGGDFSHGWIMPLISLGFIWVRRESIMKAVSRTSYAGMAVFIAALLLHWAALRAQQPRLSLVALVGVLWGIPFWLYGAGVARQLLFPCGYLLLCFTSYLMVAFAFPLRLLSSAASAVILNGIGIAAQRNGTAIYSAAGGGFNFDVADPCSGLRSLVVMTALAAPYAYMTQKTEIKRWTLFALSIPLAMFANVVRIVTIAVVAQLLGQEKAITLYHDYSGYLLFAVATLSLLGMGSLLNVNYTKVFSEWKDRELSRT
jgi:exosortase